MALVKGEDATAAVRDAVVLDLGDLRRQARAIIEAAEAERDKVLHQARSERRKLIETAAAEGVRRGIEEGMRVGREAGERAGREAALAQGRKELAQLDARWGEEIKGFIDRREQVLRASRRDVLALAVRIAERIVRRSIEVDPAGVGDAVEAALGLVLSPSRLRVCVHPEDAIVVGEVLPATASKLGLGDQVELVEDAGLSRGSVVVRTPDGEIDASVEAQLARLSEVVIPGGEGE